MFLVIVRWPLNPNLQTWRTVADRCKVTARLVWLGYEAVQTIFLALLAKEIVEENNTPARLGPVSAFYPLHPGLACASYSGSRPSRVNGCGPQL